MPARSRPRRDLVHNCGDHPPAATRPLCARPSPSRQTLTAFLTSINPCLSLPLRRRLAEGLVPGPCLRASLQLVRPLVQSHNPPFFLRLLVRRLPRVLSSLAQERRPRPRALAPTLLPLRPQLSSPVSGLAQCLNALASCLPRPLLAHLFSWVTGLPADSEATL